jgi:hypothetical protein
MIDWLFDLAPTWLVLMLLLPLAWQVHRQQKIIEILDARVMTLQQHDEELAEEIMDIVKSRQAALCESTKDRLEVYDHFDEILRESIKRRREEFVPFEQWLKQRKARERAEVKAAKAKANRKGGT